MGQDPCNRPQDQRQWAHEYLRWASRAHPEDPVLHDAGWLTPDSMAPDEGVSHRIGRPMDTPTPTKVLVVLEKRNTGIASTAGAYPVCSRNSNWLPWKEFGPLVAGRSGIARGSSREDIELRVLP